MFPSLCRAPTDLLATCNDNAPRREDGARGVIGAERGRVVKAVQSRAGAALWGHPLVNEDSAK